MNIELDEEVLKIMIDSMIYRMKHEMGISQDVINKSLKDVIKDNPQMNLDVVNQFIVN